MHDNSTLWRAEPPPPPKPVILTRVCGDPVHWNEVVYVIQQRLAKLRYKNRRQTTNWVAAELLMLGEQLGYEAVPEWGIPVENTASGAGYIDVVWLKDDMVVQAFELVWGDGTPKDYTKLLSMPRGILVRLHAHESARSLDVIKQGVKAYRPKGVSIKYVVAFDKKKHGPRPQTGPRKRGRSSFFDSR